MKSALESAANRDRILDDAHRVLTEAITQDGQENSAQAWYWLGRVYLYQGDVVGGDSALDRAETLAPECKADIQPIRFNTYIALLRPATQYMQAGQTDSAFTLLSQAAQFYDGAPHAFRFLGIIYYNRRQLDSAAYYFERALAVVEMPRDSALRDQTTFNLAAAYQNLGRYPDAIRVWRQYLGWDPNDADARKALASAFRANNMADSAAAIESDMLASGAGANLTADELINIGVRAFKDGRLDEAAGAFQRVLAENPYQHQALLNLANTYAKAENGDSLITAGTGWWPWTR